MIPLNLSRVVNNPALQQNAQILRPRYEFLNAGEWTLVAEEIYQSKGIITPTQNRDRIAYLAEGQRELHAITLYWPTELFMADGRTQEADVIIWNGDYFRVQFSQPWQVVAGYWFAIATGFAYGS